MCRTSTMEARRHGEEPKNLTTKDTKGHEGKINQRSSDPRLSVLIRGKVSGFPDYGDSGDDVRFRRFSVSPCLRASVPPWWIFPLRSAKSAKIAEIEIRP